MTIRNAYTEAAPTRTADKIRRLLARAGATEIAERYVDGEIAGLSFVVETEFGPRRFALPVNVEGAQVALKAEQKRGVSVTATVTQARRTAWRNLEDWISVQLALVASGMGTIDEVLFAYMQLPSGRTVYQAAVAARLDLPALSTAPDVIQLPARAATSRTVG